MMKNANFENKHSFDIETSLRKQRTKTAFFVFFLCLICVCMASICSLCVQKGQNKEVNSVSALTQGSDGYYIISSYSDLCAFRDQVNGGDNCSGKSFKLTANITIPGGTTWTPIGDRNNQFQGMFDGCGFKIAFGTTSSPVSMTVEYSGFFGYIAGATITRLGITGAMSVNGSCLVGGIAAWADYISGGSGSVISNCFNTANISITSTRAVPSAGGIVGNVSSCTISNCYNAGNITIVSSSSTYAAMAGGIIASGDAAASNPKSIMYNCFNVGEIKAISETTKTSYGAYAAGISPYYGVVNNCFNVGVVIGGVTYSSAKRYVGGILGYNGSATNSAYLNAAKVTLSTNTSLNVLGTIYKVYGYRYPRAVSGTSTVYKNNTTTTETNTNIKSFMEALWNTSGGTKSLTSSHFTSSIWNSSYAWNFNNIWYINSSTGYPDLIEPYIVNYNANGATSGSVPASQTGTPGSSLTLATNSGNLAKTGYKFDGWNTNSAGTGTTYAAGGTFPSQTGGSTTTLYAKWTLDTYTLTVNANGGVTYKNLMDPATISSNWSTTGNNLTLAYNASTGVYTSTISTNNDPFATTLSQTQSLSANTTYMMHVTVMNSSGTVLTGTPTQTFYRVIDSTNYNETDSRRWGSTQQQTLVTPNASGKMDFRFDNDYGGTLTYKQVWISANSTQSSYTQTLTNNAYYQIPIPTRTGYTFAGWTASTGATITNDGVVRITQNATVTAKWTANQYSLKTYAYSDSASSTTYANNATGGTVKIGSGTAGASATSNINYGSTASITAAAKTGYKFVGWYTSSAMSGTAASTSATMTTATMGTGGLTYYAKFSVQSYTVTVNKGTGISSVSGGGTYKYGASVTINATVATGYSWVNWTGASTQTAQSYKFTMGASNVTYTANAADKTAPTVTITRTDYNTFSWSSSDGVGVTGYAINTSSSTPSSWSTDKTSGSYDISSVATFYVHVKDAAGNTNKASIVAYKLTISQGAGTTLSVKQTNSSGTTFSNGAAILSGTTIYATASLKTGYKSLVLKDGSTTVANPYTVVMSAAKTIASSATANDLTFSGQTLNAGNYGTAYTSNAFTGAGNGTGSYTYTISSGAPSGASINSGSRTISFTNTTAAATYNVVVLATDDGSGKTATATMKITINKINATITLGATSGNVNFNATKTFTVKSNVAGSMTAASGNTTYVTITGGASATLTANTNTNVTYKGVKATSTDVKITITVTPTDTTNYKTTTATYTVTDVNQINATITLGATSGTVNYNGTTNFTAKSNVAGSMTAASGNTTYVSITAGASATLTANTNTTVTYKGVKATTTDITITITVTPSDANYKTTTATYTVTEVKKINVTITLGASSGSANFNSTATFTVKSNVAGSMTATSGNTSYVTVTGNASANLSANTNVTVTYKGVKVTTSAVTITVTVNPTDTTNYNSASKTFSATVNAINVSLTLSATSGNVNYNATKTFTVKSNIAGTMSVTSGNTSYVTITGGNGATLTANTASTVTYKGVKATETDIAITVSVAPSDTNYKTTTATFTVTAVNKINATITLGASSGSVTYNKTNTFTVKSNVAGKMTAASGSTDYVSITGNASADLTANTNVTVTYKGVKATTTAVTITISVTPTDTTNYKTTSKTYSVTAVNQETGTVSFTASVTSLNYNASSTFTASTNTGQTISWAKSGSVTLGATTGTSVKVTANSGTGTATVTISVPASTNYTAASNSVTITLNRINGNVSFTASTTSMNYNATYTFKATSSTGQTISWTKSGSITLGSTSGGQSVVTANSGSGTATVTITAAQNDYYKQATASVTITLNKINAAITLGATSGTVNYNGTTTFTVKSNVAGSMTAASGDTTYVSITGNASANLSANTDVTVTYKGVKATTTDIVITITVTPTDTTNYKTTTATYTVTEVKKIANTLTLSATSGTIKFPNTGTFTITKNTSGGTLSVTSSATGVATVSIDGTTVTMASKSTGSATITVTSAATTNYNSKTATYALTVSNGTMTVTPTDYSGTYDGNSHSAYIKVNVAGATVKSGSASGTYGTEVVASTTANAQVNLKTATNYTAKVTVYYQVTKQYYDTVTGSVTFEIKKASGSISYATTAVTKTYGNGAFTNTLTKTGDGTVTYSSGTTGVATINSSSGQVTIKGAGSSVITATVADGTNYTYATKTATYTLTVNKAGITLTLSMSGYTYAGTVSTPSVSGNSGSGTVTYYYSTNNVTSGGTEWKNITNTTLNAGTYYMYATVPATANYNADTSDAVQFVIARANNNLTLSATSGSLTYPATTTFTITKNEGNGTLSVASGTTGVATVSLSGTTVTVASNTTAGQSVITVTSAQSTNYNKATATYTVTVANGTITVTATGYNNVYDGSAHGITVNVTSPTGTTIKYGEVSGTYDLTSSPTLTNVGSKTVYYQVSKAGYTTKTGSATITITRKSLSVPSQKGTLTYNGSSQTPSWNNYTSSQLTIGGTNATTYTATFTPTSNYCWSDSSTTAKNVNWTIGQLQVTFKWNTTNSASGTEYSTPYIYNWEVQGVYPFITNICGSDDVALTVSNNTATNVGTYTANNLALTGTKSANYKLPSSGLTKAWEIQRAKTAVLPSQSGTLTYNGSAQSPTWDLDYTPRLAISGDTSGTNAGSYNATFTPHSNFAWSDGSTTAKTAVWTIGKATGTVTFTQKVNTLQYKASSDFKASTNTGQTISWAKNGSIILSAESGATVTITADSGTGEATVTISVPASTNYTGANASVTITLGKKDATITADNITKTYGDADFNISASTTSDGTLGYAIATGDTVISLSGKSVTIKKAGSATVTISVPATNNFNAVSKTITITINKKQATVEFVNTTATLVFEESFTFTASATNNGETPITWAKSGSITLGATSGTSVTVTADSGTGTATITITIAESTNFLGDSAQFTITLGKKDGFITMDNYVVRVGVDKTITLAPKSSHNANVSYAITSGGTLVTLNNAVVTIGTTAGVATMTATCASDNNYKEASATFTITINEAYKILVNVMGNNINSFGSYEPGIGGTVAINGGSYGISSQIAVNDVTANYVVSAKYNEGYRFSGYYADSSLATIKYSVAQTTENSGAYSVTISNITGNVTLFAKMDYNYIEVNYTNSADTGTLLVAMNAEANYYQGYVIGKASGTIYLCGVPYGKNYTIALTSNNVTKINGSNASSASVAFNTPINPTVTIEVGSTLKSLNVQAMNAPKIEVSETIEEVVEEVKEAETQAVAMQVSDKGVSEESEAPAKKKEAPKGKLKVADKVFSKLDKAKFEVMRKEVELKKEYVKKEFANILVKLMKTPMQGGRV